MTRPTPALSRASPASGLARSWGRRTWVRRACSHLVGLDDRLDRVSGGRFSVADLAGLPHLRLRVPRRGGGVVEAVLVPAAYGEEWLVTGGDDGQPVDHRTVRPAWVSALRTAREAEVVVRGTTVPVRVRRADPEERERWWPLLVRTWPGYADADAEAVEQWDVWLLTPR